MRVQRYFAPCLNDSTLQRLPTNTTLHSSTLHYHTRLFVIPLRDPPVSAGRFHLTLLLRVNFIFDLKKLFYLRKRREGNRLSLSVSFRASSASAARASYPPLPPHFGSHRLVIDGYRRTTTPDQRSSMSFPTDRRLEATVADPIPANSINPRLITRGSKLIAPPRCPALLTEDPHVNRLILRPANGAEEHAPISPRHRILSTKLLTPDPYDERLKQTTWAYSLATRKFFIADLTRVSPEGE